MKSTLLVLHIPPMQRHDVGVCRGEQHRLPARSPVLIEAVLGQDIYDDFNVSAAARTLP